MVETVINEVMHERGTNLSTLCKVLDLRKNEVEKCMSGKKKLNTLEFLSICAYLDLKVEDFT